MKNQTNSTMDTTFRGGLRFGITLLAAIACAGMAVAQPSPKYKVLMDVGHGQKFYNNPADMHPGAGQDLERIKYMTGELKKNTDALGADIAYLNGEIKAVDLAKADLLFIHIPSAKYSAAEVKAITEYLAGGGSLFLVMEVDFWSTLEQTNVNALISPFGIEYGGNAPDSLSGGYTKANPVTAKPLKITYHGGRIVKGGTPFCFTNQSEENPFGVFASQTNGGKIIVMGDGMTPLYMTSWNGVTDYQCSEFMNDALAWLLK